MLQPSFINELNILLSDHFDQEIKISSSNPVSGGDINDAYMLYSYKHKFFIKCNTAGKFPAMFETEAKGLRLLASAKEIDVPQIVMHGTAYEYDFLILDYIESSTETEDYWTDFGTKLARLHRHSSDHFGLNHDNYIGSLPQSNVQRKSWHDFFIKERLIPQINMANRARLMHKSVLHSFEKLFEKLEDLFPKEPPALVHGDLWSGNFMTGEKGQAVIIDPAVYYGHREMDIGMSKLFGGFSFEFYKAYNNEYPMEKGWEERIEICNLYPLMVHVNLFGSGYVGSVENILRRFV